MHGDGSGDDSDVQGGEEHAAGQGCDDEDGSAAWSGWPSGAASWAATATGAGAGVGVSRFPNGTAPERLWRYIVRLVLARRAPCGQTSLSIALVK